MNSAQTANADNATFAKVTARIVPLLFLGYVAAFLDRVNVGFAKLQMASDLQFSDAVYGFGAGIFFIGYFLLEVPGNLVLRKVGARLWLARIMITWGIISAAFIFTGAIHWGAIAPAFGCTDAEFTFYLLRFLLGAAEAGFYPGVIYFLTYWYPAQRRSHIVALFMAGVPVSNVFGAPISGAIMEFFDTFAGMRGWQWLFVLEALPSLLVGIAYIFLLPNGPEKAPWLNAEERALIAERLSHEVKHQRHDLAGALLDWRVWLCTLVYFCTQCAFYAVSLWMPTIVQEMGIAATDYFRVGLLAMIPWGGALVAMILWGRRSDRMGERRWHATAGLGCVVLGLLILSQASHVAVLSLLALTLVAGGVLAAVVVFWSLPTGFLTGAAAAGGIALINSFGNLGGYVGPDLVGRLRTANGGDTQIAFLVLAALALIGALAVTRVPVPTRATSSS
jgi:MFS family permease